MLVIASLHAEWTHHLPRNPMQASDATIQAKTTLKLATFGRMLWRIFIRNRDLWVSVCEVIEVFGKTGSPLIFLLGQSGISLDDLQTDEPDSI